MNQAVLPLGDTTPLYQQTNSQNPIKSPNKEETLKNNKFTQYLEAGILQAKTHKQKDDTDDNTYTKNNESISSDNKNDSDKNHKLKQTIRRITHMQILLEMIMSQVQVTAKMNLMEIRYKHRKPVNVSHHSYVLSEQLEDK